MSESAPSVVPNPDFPTLPETNDVEDAGPDHMPAVGEAPELTLSQELEVMLDVEDEMDVASQPPPEPQK